MVIQTTFIMMKAIIYLRRQQKVKWCLQSFSNLESVCTSTGAVRDTDNIAIPARFVDIGVDNAPASEKVFSQWSCKQFVWQWVGYIRNLRQEPVEWIKGRASNIFIISNSFEVDCLPVIWFNLSFGALEWFNYVYHWSKGWWQTCNHSDGLKNGGGDSVHRSWIAEKDDIYSGFLQPL